MQRILIADDHPFILVGTKTFVESKGYTITDLCSNGIAAFNSIIMQRPDIALIDISMPGMNGLEIVEKLAKQKVRTKVVLLTMHNELSVYNRAKALGVKGYLLKEFAIDELAKCLVAVARGETYFSSQLDENLTIGKPDADWQGIEVLTFSEKKILELVASERSTKQIANLLFISEKTVEAHRANIIKKLNLPPSKNALIIYAMKHFGSTK